MNSTKKTARVAGLLYLLMAISGFFSIMYIPSAFIVHGDATATANKIIASEWLFRAGIVSELVSATIFVFLVLVLYELLKGVSKKQASLMVILVIIAVSIAFLNELNELAALLLSRGEDLLSVFDKQQRDALAMVFLTLHNDGFVIGMIFWGLWLLPLGILVFRSGFLPRFLGVWLILACFGYLASSFTSLLLPRYGPVVSEIALVPEAGELAMILWLLIRGAKDQPLEAAA
jgi:hypothetical protein